MTFLSVGAMLLRYTWKDIPRTMYILAALSLYAGIWFSLSFIGGTANLFEGVRSLWGYVSVVVFALFAYWSFSKISAKLFIASVCAWTFGAIAQLFFGAQILASILARLSTDMARGLTSFAPEPAFYAAFCMACIVLNEFFYAEQRYTHKCYGALQLLLIIQITLAASGVGIVLLFLYGLVNIGTIVFSKTKGSRVRALCSIVLIVSSLLFQRYVYVNKEPLISKLFTHEKAIQQTAQPVSLEQKSRAASIISQSFGEPILFVQKDNSTRHRLFNIVIGAYGGIVKGKGMGMGIGSVNTTAIPPWLAKLIGENRNFGGRIEGGLSQVVYELGIIGVVYTGVIVFLLIKSIMRSPRIRSTLILSACVIFVPYALFGTLSFPLFGYLLGIHVYYLKKRDI